METKTKPRTFYAKCHNQVLVVESDDYLRDETGRRYGQKEGRRIVFEGNVFLADEKSAERVGMTLDELIEWLHNHEQFNATIWDEGEPPDQIRPTVKEVSASILAAVSRKDPDAIALIREEEQETHNRSAVLQTADAALEELAGATTG